MESDNMNRDEKYSGFWSWWVEKLARTEGSARNFAIKEISGNGKYRKYLEPIGGLEDDIEAWFDSDFESVEMTYDALGIVKGGGGPLSEFLSEYKTFLHDNYYFILSNSAESPEVGRSYMKNVGIKILNRTYRGKPYLDNLCLFGRLVEESLLSTDEAKALREKWRAACPCEHGA